MKPLYLLLLIYGMFLVIIVPTAHAQEGPEKGDRELQIWTSGGYGVKGIYSNTGVWTVGFRYGWVLTTPRGPGFLRERLEYATDVAPVFVVSQPRGTAYGFALSPLNLRWNFDRQGLAVPFVEVSGGTLLTNLKTPPGISRENFVTTSAVGLNFIGANLHWSVAVEFAHISDSGLTPINPGINTVQLRLGLGVFRTRHQKE